MTAKNILIVDDDPDMVEFTRIVLEAAGYGVRAASGGAEALRMVEEEPPDLILLDVMMSDPTEGLHLGYRLRNHPSHARIPIIIVSSISARTGFDLAAGRKEGYIQADDVLEKPVEPGTLLNRIQALLGGKGG